MISSFASGFDYTYYNTKNNPIPFILADERSFLTVSCHKGESKPLPEKAFALDNSGNLRENIVKESCRGASGVPVRL